MVDYASFWDETKTSNIYTFDYQLNTITQKNFFSEKNAIYSAKMTLIPN